MLIGLRVKLGWWDGDDAQLHEQEPAELEIARPLGDVWGEGVFGREVHFGEIGEDEVPAVGFGVLKQSEIELGWRWKSG